MIAKHRQPQILLHLEPIYDGGYSLESSMTQFKFKRDEFIISAALRKQHETVYQFDCTFQFNEDEGSFIVTSFAGIHNHSQELTCLSDLPEDAHFWDTFETIFQVIFGIDQVDIGW